MLIDMYALNVLRSDKLVRKIGMKVCKCEEILFNIYILNAFTEKPYSKLMRRNVIYNPITTLSRAMSHDR